MDPAPFNTKTMAELFAAQGKAGRAIGILRHVVRQHPFDAHAALRLAELEAAQRARGPPMIFRDTMRAIVEAVPGATACALMGYDGIAIDSYEVGGSGLDIPVLLAEFAVATEGLRQTGQQQPLSGTMHELMITTDNLTAVIRLLNDEYYLAMVLGNEGLSGKARFLLRQAAPAFVAEL